MYSVVAPHSSHSPHSRSHSQAPPPSQRRQQQQQQQRPDAAGSSPVSSRAAGAGRRGGRPTADGDTEAIVAGDGDHQHNHHHHQQRHHHRQSVYRRVYTFVRSKFVQEQDEEGEEFSFHIARYKPEELHKLASKTKFTRKEIQLMYRGFKQECPTGMVDEDSFKHIFSQFFPQGDATNYAHYVFNTIKQKDANKISFEDFLAILSKVSRGSVEEKLQWVFGLYDLDGDGLISKTEMVDVVTSIYEMLGRSTTPQVEASSAKEHAERIFHLIDTNKDGVVTIEELVDWCSRDEGVLRSLNTLDTVL